MAAITKLQQEPKKNNITSSLDMTIHTGGFDESASLMRSLYDLDHFKGRVTMSGEGARLHLRWEVYTFIELKDLLTFFEVCSIGQPIIDRPKEYSIE